MTIVIGGILLPVEVLQSEFFAVLAAFVAINTIMYVTLAIAKILPRVYVSDLFHRRNRRRRPRGIAPAPDQHKALPEG
jgi:hypothetical protein